VPTAYCITTKTIKKLQKFYDYVAEQTAPATSSVRSAEVYASQNKINAKEK